jgi:hypothetical protein
MSHFIHDLESLHDILDCEYNTPGNFINLTSIVKKYIGIDINRDKLDNYIIRILEQPLSKMLNNYIDEMLSFGARQREEEIDHLMYVWRLHTTERNADAQRFVIGCFKSGRKYFLSYLKRKIYQARHRAKKERDENKSNEYYWTTRYEEVEEIIANF